MFAVPLYHFGTDIITYPIYAGILLRRFTLCILSNLHLILMFKDKICQ